MPWPPLLALWVLLVLLAATLRNRVFATFVGVVLGVQCLVWLGLRHCVPENLRPLLAAGQSVTFLHYAALIRPRLRSRVYRLTVSLPALWFAAGTMFALPVALVCPWLDAPRTDAASWIVAVPWLLATVGLAQSLRARASHVALRLDSSALEGLRRLPVRETPLGAQSGPENAACPQEPEGGVNRRVPADTPSPQDRIRVEQLSDPHLGPFVSPRRLRRACERIVARGPDLVLFTGDLLTMESQAEPEKCRWALEPLAELRGRVFACLGNHDLEAPTTFRYACESNSIRVLVDQHVEVLTPAGPLQIVGLSHRFGQGADQNRAVLSGLPEPAGRDRRIVLLHDPSGFAALEDGTAPLVLAGHTHGGQVGLISLGIDWTLLRLLAPRIPDHGFWGLGRNRLYVQRGLGHYGFPLRVGVPSQEGILEIEWE